MLNPTFYETIMSSKEWQAWDKYMRQELKWDTVESAECDWLSPEHFEAFLDFVKNKYEKVI